MFIVEKFENIDKGGHHYTHNTQFHLFLFSSSPFSTIMCPYTFFMQKIESHCI